MSVRPPIRLIAWAVALTLIALPLVGLMRGWFASASWPIRTLEVQAEYRHVSADEIRAAVLPHIHKGFFATHLDTVQNAVDALPWVASAEARKRWPDTLVIQVHERHPFAHWNRGKLIDHRGKVFAVPGADQVRGLPHLSGPKGRLDDVLAFYHQVNERLAGVGLHARGVHLDSRGGWSLDLADGARLVIGRTEPTRRLTRFVRVYPQLAGTHKQPFLYADLRYTNGFAVRWPSPATTSAAAGGASRT